MFSLLVVKKIQQRLVRFVKKKRRNHLPAYAFSSPPTILQNDNLRGIRCSFSHFGTHEVASGIETVAGTVFHSE